MVGSEGTLGIVTRIILRLIPLPKAQVDLLVPFDSFGKAAQTVADMADESLVPTAIEFMERGAVKASERLLGRDVPFSDSEAQLLIQITGPSQEQVEDELDQVGELCLDHGAVDVLVAQDRPTRERLWEARRLIIEALKHESPVNHTEDVSVPRSQIPPLLRGIHEISDRVGIEAVCFGHAGDGNVHVNFLKRDVPDETWESGLEIARKDLYALTMSLGGTITGEHGIGAIRIDALVEALGETQVTLMRQIKRAFDPNGILNPGKILAWG
jgi:glycolate oxidase